jgi:hypothetical protein
VDPSVTACISKRERDAPDIVAAGVDIHRISHILWISACCYVAHKCDKKLCAVYNYIASQARYQLALRWRDDALGETIGLAEAPLVLFRSTMPQPTLSRPSGWSWGFTGKYGRDS